MSDSFNWTCPVCGSHTTVTSPNFSTMAFTSDCRVTPTGEAIKVRTKHIECPNIECKSQYFEVRVNHARDTGGHWVADEARPVGIGRFTFLPVVPIPLSSHVPTQVTNDYAEASLIAALSPKAAATLARRALQGMVRDFFKISGKRTLHEELVAIRDECDAGLYEAMMAVKSVGNIGAHPEQDVNLIVDVDPGEAETLLQLIHLLDREWYVARAERLKRIAKMTQLAVSKNEAKKGIATDQA
ncbi:DUF4145 domain-containing protein [Acidovorax sp. FG27]|uniref:DUF4145 domain-containing protein n=1 Tax=Acidovorax sp. FG27 TaxID=3133652 RepID=UPI0030E89F42